MNKRGLSQLGQRIQPPPITWLMNLSLSRPHLISLAAGFTDNESLPVREVQAVTELLFQHASRGQSTLQYGSDQGDAELRHLTAEWIRQSDGLKPNDGYDADEFLITHGSQQLLYLLAEALCDPGNIVLVEDPTYFVFLGILQSHGIQCRGIRMESDGLNLTHLESTLESLKKDGKITSLKALYLVSYFQNPSGRTTSFEKKIAVLELLKNYEKFAKHPLYLIEDAAYRELRFQGEDVPSALLDKQYRDRVVYTGTYSKPFATGIRVGYGRLPEPLRSALMRIKGNHDFGTSNLLQQILREALKTGRFQAHLQRLRKRYAKKAATMVEAIQSYFPSSVHWEKPCGGLYVWAKTPAHIKTGMQSPFFKTLLDRGVVYVPGQLCYGPDPTRPRPNREMRISFGGAKLKEIPIGIQRMGETLRES